MVSDQDRSDMIALRVIRHTETEFEMSRAFYAAAKAAGTLPQLVCNWLHLFPSGFLVVVEPDGTMVDPHYPDRSRPSLVAAAAADAATAAISEVVRLAPVSPGCRQCSEITGACPLHIARAVVGAVRAENLVLVDQETADGIIGDAVSGAQAQARADERRLVLEEICALAGDLEKLRRLTESAGSDPAGSVGLARARSLLRELAAVGGPIDVRATS